MSIFDRGAETYLSDIVLGERYRDLQTGIEGVATALHFYEHACERVTLEAVSDKSGELLEYSFDAPRLRAIGDPDREIVKQHTGGPVRAEGRRGRDTREGGAR